MTWLILQVKKQLRKFSINKILKDKIEKNSIKKIKK